MCCFVKTILGKASLVTVYTTNMFPTGPIEEKYNDKTVTLYTFKGPLRLRLCNTPGGNAPAIAMARRTAYGDASVVVLCYAVNNRNSFERIFGHWIREVRQYEPYARLFLVACKIDLRPQDADETQFVSKEEGYYEARRIGARFVETSAIEGRNVQELFRDAIRSTIQPRRMPRRAVPGGCIIS